jgi:hypothetical protein
LKKTKFRWKVSIKKILKMERKGVDVIFLAQNAFMFKSYPRNWPWRPIEL